VSGWLSTVKPRQKQSSPRIGYVAAGLARVNSKQWAAVLPEERHKWQAVGNDLALQVL